jgi:hypothetical protein
MSSIWTKPVALGLLVTFGGCGLPILGVGYVMKQRADQEADRALKEKEDAENEAHKKERHDEMVKKAQSYVRYFLIRPGDADFDPVDTVEEFWGGTEFCHRVTGRGVGRDSRGLVVRFWYVVTVKENDKSYDLEECFVDGKKYYPATPQPPVTQPPVTQQAITVTFRDLIGCNMDQVRVLCGQPDQIVPLTDASGHEKPGCGYWYYKNAAIDPKTGKPGKTLVIFEDSRVYTVKTPEEAAEELKRYEAQKQAEAGQGKLR